MPIDPNAPPESLSACVLMAETETNHATKRVTAAAAEAITKGFADADVATTQEVLWSFLSGGQFMIDFLVAGGRTAAALLASDPRGASATLQSALFGAVGVAAKEAGFTSDLAARLVTEEPAPA